VRRTVVDGFPDRSTVRPDDPTGVDPIPPPRARHAPLRHDRPAGPPGTRLRTARLRGAGIAPPAGRVRARERVDPGREPGDRLAGVPRPGTPDRFRPRNPWYPVIRPPGV